MKILPKLQARFFNTGLGRILRRRFFYEIPQDTFESVTPKTVSKFKHIKLKIAEKMYNAEFTPSDIDYGKYSYKAFVFDKKTDMPVEVVVKPRIFESIEEYYLILDPHNPITPETIARSGGRFANFNNENWGMPVVGIREFFYDDVLNNITCGTMSAYGNDIYEGLGFIEHQMAVERFLMTKRKNLDICSTPSAYWFHRNCGFEVVKDYMALDAGELAKEIRIYVQNSGLDEETIKNLLVCRKISKGSYIFDKNSTFENIIKQLYKKNKSLKGFNYFCVDMRLSKEALKEWKKIIEKHPILMGQKMPRRVRPHRCL